MGLGQALWRGYRAYGNSNRTALHPFRCASSRKRPPAILLYPILYPVRRGSRGCQSDRRSRIGQISVSDITYELTTPLFQMSCLVECSRDDRMMKFSLSHPIGSLQGAAWAHTKRTRKADVTVAASSALCHRRFWALTRTK